MGGKKKKSPTKIKKEKEVFENEINPNFLVKPDASGWIKLELRLCDPPFNKINSFKVSINSKSTLNNVAIIKISDIVDNTKIVAVSKSHIDVKFPLSSSKSFTNETQKIRVNKKDNKVKL